MTSEAKVMSDVRAVLARVPGVIVWRNNVGCLTDARGRYVTYGLCVGSSDLIGLCHGRFLAIECKAPGKKPLKAQLGFVEMVNREGGIGLWCDSAEDMVRELSQHLRPSMTTCLRDALAAVRAEQARPPRRVVVEKT